ncbi:MAG: hypothetical protein WAL25_06605 [Acidimicrobiia bacterium]
MEQEVDERHPLRFLVKFAVFAGLLYVAGRFLAQKKDEFADLTESQARDKLVEKMAPRVGDETAEDIADQVIPKLKDRGLIKADPMDAASQQVADAAEKLGEDIDDKIDDAADAVADAVDSVVKD